LDARAVASLGTAGAAPNWGSLASAQHWGLGAGTRIQYRVISNLAPPVALCTKWLHYGFSSEAYILTNCGGVDRGPDGLLSPMTYAPNGTSSHSDF
jgi:hypothetical protein